MLRVKEGRIPWAPVSGGKCPRGKTARTHGELPDGQAYAAYQPARTKRDEANTVAIRLDRLYRLRNDLYCVGWGVKLYLLTRSFVEQVAPRTKRHHHPRQ